MTLGDLADRLGGTAHGPAELELVRPGAHDDAQPGEVVVAFDAAAVAVVEQGAAAAAVVPRDVACAKPSIAVDDPRAALPALLQLFAPPPPAPTGIHPLAVVDPTAVIGADPSLAPGVVVGPGAVVGDRCVLGANSVIGAECQLGDDVTLAPNVVLYPRCWVGSRVIIHSGAVIGADGFGYRFSDGRHLKIPHLGNVVIEDDAEIGANTAIDRAVLGSTRVGQGAKIDNLVQIAHNCRIGRHALLVGQVGLAGSVTIGHYAVLAGQVGVADHRTIGDQATVGAQAGVMHDIPAGEVVMGAPAVPQVKFFRQLSLLRRLEGLRRQLRLLERLDCSDDQEG